MAISVATGEVVQVLIQGTIEGQECENVIYFRAQAADVDMVLHLLAEIGECFLALVPILAPSYTFERIRGKIVSPAIGLDAVWEPPPGSDLQGEDAGGGMPSFVSALISLQAERAGRSGKGRMFMAGVPEEAAQNSILASDAAFYTALITFATCVLTKFSKKDVPAAGDYEWGVMSRKIGGQKPPFLSAGFAPVVGFRVARALCTTRTRKVGRGR